MNSRRDPEWASRVRPIIQARLEIGLLPTTASPQRIWAGPGLDKTCDACDSIIERDDTEFEVDFGIEGSRRFHAGCQIVWQQERARQSKR